MYKHARSARAREWKGMILLDNDLPTVRWLLRLLISPGWAPLGVVIIHLALAEFGLTNRFDHLLHFWEEPR